MDKLTPEQLERAKKEFADVWEIERPLDDALTDAAARVERGEG